MNIEIKSRWDGHVIISGDYDSIKECLEKNRDANLGSADLGSANLEGTDLRGADLEGTKEYRDSHDIFKELISRQPVDTFVDEEWVAIAQITIHTLCWDSIKKRFGGVMGGIFDKLAAQGFTEWKEYWETIK